MRSYNEIKVKKFLVLGLLFIVLTPLSYPSIFKITVDTAIHPVTSEYIRNTIDRAEEENS